MESSRVLCVENEEHLEKFLNGFITHAKFRLDHVLERLDSSPKTKSLLTEWGKKERTYPLMCGFAQELLTYNLKDAGYTANPFTSDSIRESSFSHCAVSIPVDVKENGSRIYIMLDPTFTQFALPANLYPAFGLREIQARKSPLAALDKTKEGQTLWTELKESGFFVITPDKAGLYVESLCPNSGVSPIKAAHMLENPRFHTTNLKHGRSRLSMENCLGIDVNKILEDTKRPENPHPERFSQEGAASPSP